MHLLRSRSPASGRSGGQGPEGRPESAGRPGAGILFFYNKVFIGGGISEAPAGFWRVTMGSCGLFVLSGPQNSFLQHDFDH